MDEGWDMVSCALLQRMIKDGLHDEQKSEWNEEENCAGTWKEIY